MVCYSNPALKYCGHPLSLTATEQAVGTGNSVSGGCVSLLANSVTRRSLSHHAQFRHSFQFPFSYELYAQSYNFGKSFAQSWFYSSRALR